MEKSDILKSLGLIEDLEAEEAKGEQEPDPKQDLSTFNSKEIQ